MFRAAHTALDLADVGAEEETMSEGRLRAHVAAWEREKARGPRYVAPELETAHDALLRARTDATVWAARADAEPDPLQADQLRAATEAAHQRAAQLAPIVADLEFADDVRAAFLVETAVTRDKAERARIAAGLRGIDLDNPAERVTAQEWLDADHAATLAADADRAITDHDLPDHDLPDHADEPERVNPADSAHGNEPDPRADDARRDPAGPDNAKPGHRPPDDTCRDDILGGPVPDIRETAVRDAGERVDPAQRRRVPLPDETAATVDRARLVLAEIQSGTAMTIPDVYLLTAHEPYTEPRHPVPINALIVHALTLRHPAVPQPDGAMMFRCLTEFPGRHPDEIIPVSTLTFELDGGRLWPHVADWMAVTDTLVALARAGCCDAMTLGLPDVAAALIASSPVGETVLHYPDGTTERRGPAHRHDELDKLAVHLWPGTPDRRCVTGRSTRSTTGNNGPQVRAVSIRVSSAQRGDEHSRCGRRGTRGSVTTSRHQMRYPDPAEGMHEC